MNSIVSVVSVSGACSDESVSVREFSHTSYMEVRLGLQYVCVELIDCL